MSPRASLAAAFRAYVAAEPDAHALFCRSEGGGEGILSRRDLLARVERLAAGLSAAGVIRGDRVVLALRTSVEWVACFWALQWLGAVAVPVAPPAGQTRRQQGLGDLARICAVARPRVVVGWSEDLAWPGCDFTLRSPDALDRDGMAAAVAGPAAIAGDDLAVLQFTSGSTGHPKGCALTQHAMLTNATAIAERMDIRAGDTAVSWLPTFHDMGLMTGVLAPVVAGTSARLRESSRFLVNPISWLEDLARFPRTHTAAPNFALALVLDRLARRPAAGLDLSGVATIVCGAEPIDAALATRFLETLAPWGLQAEAFHAAYGMAEATLLVTSRPRGLTSRRFRLPPVGEAATEQAGAPPAGETTLVNLGRPVEGVEIRIVGKRGDGVDPEVGEVEIRSPSLMRAYFHNPEATDAALQDGWLRTGDLGLVCDGDLYIAGRAKDLIIVAGRNIYPSDVEHAVARATGLLASSVAAFARRSALGTDAVCLLIECPDRADVERLVQLAEASCLEACGAAPALVITAVRGAIPRTTSGKVRRSELSLRHAEALA